MSAVINSNNTIELTIVREFAHPPEKVFEAWLQPEQLAQWMGPSDEVSVTNITVEAQEGGAYHMQFNESDDSVHKVNGVYKTINRYTQLIFTWAWEPPTPGGGEETLVTLDFEPTDTGTRLTLLHQKFSSQELCDHHYEGWTGCLDKYERKAEQL